MPEMNESANAGKSAETSSNEGALQNTQSAEGAEVTETSADAGDGEDLGSLDLENLDLTVETVEERISPSETNVFDK